MKSTNKHDWQWHHGHGPINQLKQMVCRGVREVFIEKGKQRSLLAYHDPWFASVSTCWALAAAEARELRDL